MKVTQACRSGDRYVVQLADPQDIPVLFYNVDPSWTTREKDDVEALSRQLTQALARTGHPTESVALSDGSVADSLSSYDPESVVVFNWCEGVPGVPRSEPLVARELTALGFVHTGADSEALERAQDKRAMKDSLQELGIPTPRWRIYETPDPDGWDRFPAIVKAAYEHCSEGLTPESVVMDEDELAVRIHQVIAAFDQPALVEDFVDGREFHVSLWGNGTIEVLPVAEMDFSGFTDFHDRLCTYESKFVPGSKHYEGIRTLLPSPLSDAQIKPLSQVCREAYRAVGCRDYGRIDVRERDGVYYVLDVNPNADISSDASLACATEVAGYSYGETGSRIVRLASHRHPKLGAC
jgi:D-alanine-D-alanine ligase